MALTIEEGLERIAVIMEVQARKDFLLLTYSPERVRKILQDQYADIRDNDGYLSTESRIVAKPE